MDNKKYEEINGRLKDFIKNKGGEILSEDRRGKKKLAYPIQKKKEGFYIVMSFKLDPVYSKEFEKIVKFTDGILRHITLKKDGE